MAFSKKPEYFKEYIVFCFTKKTICNGKKYILNLKGDYIMKSCSFNLSPKEESFFNVMNKVNCMTMKQAILFLRKYLSCSESQSAWIIQNLSNHQAITISKDKSFVTVGSISNSAHALVNTKTIRAMHVCIDLVDTLNDMLFTHIPSDNTDLVFLAGQQMYKVVELRMNELYKVAAMQQAYVDFVGYNQRQSNGKSTFSYITLFTIPSSENKENVLKYFESANINFPAAIAYFNSDRAGEKADYELFMLSEE